MNVYKQPFYIFIYYIPVLVLLGGLTFLTSLLNNYQIVLYVILGLMFGGSLYYFIWYAFREIAFGDELVVSYFKREKLRIEFSDIIKVEDSRNNCAVFYRINGKIRILNVSRLIRNYPEFIKELHQHVKFEMNRW